MARVLVVDDDRVQRMVATHALTLAGHEVLEAHDGAQAMESVRLNHPDLIVCDVVMPGMDGFQFLAALRQEEGIAGIPVIMLTSMAERTHMRAGMNAGADDYLAKPFSFDELTEAVSALLAKRRNLQEGLINSMNTSFVTALEEQRELLAAQYEQRLVREIGERWNEGANDDAELRYDHAVLLKAGIVGSLSQQAKSSKDVNALVRRAYDAARDTLHLFNAAHLLPAGNDIVAVYVDEPGSIRVRAAVRAVRASLGLLQKLSQLRAGNAGEPAATIALHCGPIAVLHMSDPLHGGPASSLATGTTMNELDTIFESARTTQWAITASPTFVGTMAGQLTTGRGAQAMPIGGGEPLDVIEVISLR